MADQNDLNKPELGSSYADEVFETIRGHVKRLWTGDYTGMANLVTGMRRWVVSSGNVQLKQRNAAGGEDVLFDSANKADASAMTTALAAKADSTALVALATHGSVLLTAFSGNWTCPANVSRVKATLVSGGGGGGGGGNSPTDFTDLTGTGGSAGQSGETIIGYANVTSGQIYPYVCGTGGVAGGVNFALRGSAGVNGGPTTMFSLNANGGQCGFGGTLGGALYATDVQGQGGGGSFSGATSMGVPGCQGQNSVPRVTVAGSSSTYGSKTVFTLSLFPLVGSGNYGVGGRGGGSSNYRAGATAGDAGTQGAIYLEW